MKAQLDPILEPLMAAVRRAERFFGPEDDWVEDDRRILFEWLERHLGDFHSFVYQKGPRDYVTTVDADHEAVETLLLERGGYQRNLASSRKYREHHEGGRQWAVGSYVYDPVDTDWQHHVYLFESETEGTDIYAHRETSVREGIEHLTETGQTHADPHVIFDVLDRNGLEYHEREINP